MFGVVSYVQKLCSVVVVEWEILSVIVKLMLWEENIWAAVIDKEHQDQNQTPSTSSL